MKKLLASTLSTAAALTLGLGLTVTAPPEASAQQRAGQKSGPGNVSRSAPRVHAHSGHNRHAYGHGHRHRHGGRIAAGVAAGIGTAIILNEISRPSYGSTYYSSDGLSCGQLEARCDAGHEWACRRLDRDPNC